MEHKIVISGEGSAHPKLGVKKKNSVEENLKILNDMIESRASSRSTTPSRRRGRAARCAASSTAARTRPW